MRFAFVTGNRGKFLEASQIAHEEGVELEPLEIPTVEIQSDSLEEVALYKARSIRREVSTPFFVEDAGLFVEALRGFPGVFSSFALRTLGLEGILKLLEGSSSRRARFEAVVVGYGPDGREVKARGSVEGRISPTIVPGPHGFGFDPIFIPHGDSRAFSEIPPKEKSARSHRGQALRSFFSQVRGDRRSL